MGRRDQEQRQRRSRMFGLSVSSVFALALGLNAIGKLQAGETDFAVVGFALMVALTAWLALALLHGRDGGSRKVRKFLEDEWTRSLRASAMTWGYVVLLGGASAAYAVSLWRPEWSPAALAVALAVGAIVPLLRFALLDKAADPADE